MYICKKCNKEYKSKKACETHELKCQGIKKFICKECGIEFKSGKALTGHVRFKHKGFKMAPKEKECECEICKEKFKDVRALKAHIRCLHKELNQKREYICPICNKQLFMTSAGFKIHIKNHNKEWKKIKDENIKLAKEEFFNDEERSKEYLEQLSKRMTGFKHSEETKKKISKSVKNYMSNLSDEEYSKIVMNYINAPLRGNVAGHVNRYEPTKPEQMIIDLNIEGLIYNGNKKDAKIIRFQNTNYRKTSVPDFLYKDTNKLVEVFGNYWHPKEHEELYLNACKENGYELLILWEDEIYNNFDQCILKINNFIK